MAEYARIIIDISHESLDRVFEYRIPEELREEIGIGSVVEIPFGQGNRRIKGYVTEFTKKPAYDETKIKEICGVLADPDEASQNLIRLAGWIREQYGSTMIQALKLVLPIRKKVKTLQRRWVDCLLSREDLEEYIALCRHKKYAAKQRLAEAMLSDRTIPLDMIRQKLSIADSTLAAMKKDGVIAIREEEIIRGNRSFQEVSGERPVYTSEQQAILDEMERRHQEGYRDVSLIYGVTGSGKTEIYIERIARTLEEGKQAIVLVPEIALTYQTVMRFYRRFGDRICVMNSRLSDGERQDQLQRARRGDASIMIGPRSALFAPFPNLGLIVIDEEHESAYQSENAPRYHARETAVERARLSGAEVILGSATPSLEAFSRAKSGEYRLYTLKNRAKAGSILPQVYLVDLREEMKNGNKSIFSSLLREKITDRLEKKEQIMLFLNRRGYASFVSCRSCGEAMQCPHCDVALKYHADGSLRCHYCGYQTRAPKLCPECGSPYIAPFGIGTQKVEQMLISQFPDARVLRMDADTTSAKQGHEQILEAFREGKADILLGTQMIVKGHDFPKVTLVGALAADLSLNTPDFRGAEHTFQLLTQAAGRAGRAESAGEVVIQTYQPEHYSILEASRQDYDAFYGQEIVYRKLLHYPPTYSMMTLQIVSAREDVAEGAARFYADLLRKDFPDEEIIGPADAPILKISDMYRKRVYLKSEDRGVLNRCRDRVESVPWEGADRREYILQFAAE